MSVAEQNETQLRCPIDFEKFSLFSEEYIADPYPYLDQFRQSAPVFLNEETGFWIVSRYADIKKCLLDRETFSSKNVTVPLKPLCPAAGAALQDAGVVVTSTLVDEDNPEHTRHRKVVQNSFVPARLRELEGFIRQQVVAGLDQIAEQGHADINQGFGFKIPSNVIMKMMNVPIEDMDKIAEWGRGMANFVWGMPSDEQQTALARNMGEYWKYGNALVKQNLGNPEESLIGDMAKQHRVDPADWNEEYITWLGINTLFAGHETTAAGFANAVRLLLEHIDQWNQIVADPALIPNAVEEILRHRGPVLAWRRVTTRDVELSGVTLPAGANVKLMLAAANHDPDVFENPTEFDIHRTNASRHLTFGFGGHMCIGAAVARLELNIMLEELACRLPHIRLAAQQDWSYPFTTTHRGPEHVMCEWDPARNPPRPVS